MFRNLTLAQQMFFFVLAVFLILLVFRILVKLKLAPVLVYAACANLIFPEWVAEQKALYWAILAGLVLVTIFRWVGPRLTAHMEEQRIMREIVEQSRAAEAMGYRNGQISFEVKDGTANQNQAVKQQGDGPQARPPGFCRKSPQFDGTFL